MPKLFQFIQKHPQHDMVIFNLLTEAKYGKLYVSLGQHHEAGNFNGDMSSIPFDYYLAGFCIGHFPISLGIKIEHCDQLILFSKGISVSPTASGRVHFLSLPSAEVLDDKTSTAALDQIAKLTIDLYILWRKFFYQTGGNYMYIVSPVLIRGTTLLESS